MTFNLAIDLDNISNEMIELPQQLAIANQRYADAMLDTARAKAKRDQTIALVAIAARDAARSACTKMTEAQLEESVRVHRGVVSAVDEYATAEHREASARGLCDALKAKRDMLMMLGARLRGEQHDPRTPTSG